MTVDRDRIAAALPNYEIRAELGQGAWGVVLAAEHRQLGRGVAVKQLPQGFAANPTIQRRFNAEARLLASLDHPHIVPIFDYVEDHGLCLLVMELLPGGTVRDRFNTEGIAADAACSIALATCAALHYAHARAILHRDIKPENLLFSSSGNLKVTDFGIAKVLGGAETLVTKTGELLGTPAYMAPEQVMGNALTPATDVYAVATMLYELLSGELPFSDEGGVLTALFRHAHEEPTPLLAVAPAVPPRIAAVVMQGLATSPAERPQSAEDFGVALTGAANDSWGPGWLDGTDLEVIASKRLAQRISDPQQPAEITGSPKALTRPLGSIMARTNPPVFEEASPEDVTRLADFVGKGSAVAGPPEPLPAPPSELPPTDVVPTSEPPFTSPAPPAVAPVAPTPPPPAPAGPVGPGPGPVGPGPVGPGPVEPGPVGPGPGGPGRRRRAMVLGAVVAAIVIVGAAVLFVALRPKGKAAATPPGSTGSSTTVASATTVPAAHSVFADDFSDHASGWMPDPNQTGFGTGEYRSDGYYVTVLQPLPVLNTFSVASPFLTKLASIRVSADVTLVTAAAGDGAGVRCDQIGRTTLRYTFEIFGDGTWIIFRIDNGGVALKMGSSAAINTAGGRNTVTGQCTEVGTGATALTMAVNGTSLGTVTDTHAPGALAWHAALVAYRSAGSPATVVRFNNFHTLAVASG